MHSQSRTTPTLTSTRAGSSLLQRKCGCGGAAGFDGECVECRKKRLRRRSAVQSGNDQAPAIVQDVLRSSGRSLDPATRTFFESRFGQDSGRTPDDDSRTIQTKVTVNQPGDRYEQKADRMAEQVMRTPARPQAGYDFTRARVHTDTRAAASARAVNALAYTVGNDVVFEAGQYAPETSAGRRLTAHELAHVIQHGVTGSRVQRTPACKNQAQVDDRIKANPRGYPSTVTMYAHQIVSGDALHDLGRSTMGDNTVHVFGHYFAEIKALNSGINVGTVDNCVLLLRGWTDPAIGALPAKPTGALPGEAQRAVATIYAEQTSTTAQGQEHQKYIWYSIRMRLGLGLHGPTIDDVLDKGGYYGKGTSHYTKALADLAKPSPALAGVITAKSIVLSNWDTPIPSDAGPYYFHWRPGSTPEKCFASKKDEKACAWEYANARQIAATVTKAGGWHHKISGDTSPPDDRIGSMYIYK